VFVKFCKEIIELDKVVELGHVFVRKSMN
jgi:hypothetical protein